MAFLNESHIEEADIQFFELMLGYTHKDAWEKQLIGRDSLKDVVLKEDLRTALVRLNPNLPKHCIEFAIDELSKSRANLNASARALNILKFSSMPGTSRHHWGTEIDINSFNNSWFTYGEGLRLFNWMNNNAAKYGFHRPYTAKNKNRPNGYNEEKWHWSYTPLSIPMLRDAYQALSNDDIRGFSGSNTASKIGIKENYILGVDKSCQ